MAHSRPNRKARNLKRATMSMLCLPKQAPRVKSVLTALGRSRAHRKQRRSYESLLQISNLCLHNNKRTSLLRPYSVKPIPLAQSLIDGMPGACRHSFGQTEVTIKARSQYPNREPCSRFQLLRRDSEGAGTRCFLYGSRPELKPSDQDIARLSYD
jgi:hypothetical protein